MTWDPTWDTVYQHASWGRYPPEELVRFIARHYYDVPDRSAIRILEIGCGAGANLWYLAREGFRCVGVDGSQTALFRAMERMEEEPLATLLRVEDYVLLDAQDIEKWSGPDNFDAVIDVCCLQHNRWADILAIRDQMMAVLIPGGMIFSMMVTADSWGACSGKAIEPGTLTDIAQGPCAGKGVTHFTTLQGATELWGGLADLNIERSTRTMAGRAHEYGHWVIEGRKAG